MAAQIHAAQQFHAVKIFKDQSIGLGSYGAVYRAHADRLPCAAKLLHPILFHDRDPGVRRIQERFEQECHFLSGIRHPNIVQYLGMCRDHDSGLPVLLMELMDESLTHFLEKSPEPLPYHLEVNFSHDVALALDYLHSHEIIHRDLSSNNVLLIANSRAKVTDFGMSKLLDTALHVTSQTQCPGTIGYMSPEALRTPPVYTRKLDCFSLGVLNIQIMTRQFPDPGPARHVVEDPRYPAGAVEVPVLERERRKCHIDLISPNHPLLSTALRCLEYHERNRPSAQELCDQLATLKEDPRYTQSVQQARERGREGESATADTAAEDKQIAELRRRLAVRDTDIERLRSQLQEKEEVVSAKEDQIRQLQLLAQENSRVIEEHVREQTSEQVTAEFQENLQQKERRIRDLEENISTKEETIRMLREQLKSIPQVSRSPDVTALKWKECQKPPETLSRRIGAVAADASVVYICNYVTMYAYNSERDNWERLPDCPQSDSSLAIVSGLLTAVGGIESNKPTDTLVSLTGEDTRWKWSKHFPPMPTRRQHPAVVCSGRSLVAAGGYRSGERLSVVEVMDTDTLQWLTASSLLHPFDKAVATICGDNLYLLGGVDHLGRTKSVLTCSLNALLQSSQPQSLAGRLKKTLTLEDPVWRRVADLPFFKSTCTTFCGHVLAIGGEEGSYRNTNAVYKYDPTKNTWSIISHVPKAFCDALVAPLPGNKLMVCRDVNTYIGSIMGEYVRVLH